jgi:hypothetical protein
LVPFPHKPKTSCNFNHQSSPFSSQNGVKDELKTALFLADKKMTNYITAIEISAETRASIEKHFLRNVYNF